MADGPKSRERQACPEDRLKPSAMRRECCQSGNLTNSAMPRVFLGLVIQDPLHSTGYTAGKEGRKGHIQHEPVFVRAGTASYSYPLG